MAASLASNATQRWAAAAASPAASAAAVAAASLHPSTVRARPRLACFSSSSLYSAHCIRRCYSSVSSTTSTNTSNTSSTKATYKQSTPPPPPSPTASSATLSSASPSPSPSSRSPPRYVYSVGTGCFGGLGNSSYRDQPVPLPISSLSSIPISSIACGWCHNLAISTTGDVYLWGYKPFIRALSFTAKLHRRFPSVLTFLQELGWGRFTFSNANTTPTLTRLVTLGGSKDRINREGHTDSSSSSSSSSNSSSGSSSRPHVIAGSCGGDFCAVLSSAGDIYTLGNGFFGQLGHSSSLPHTLLTSFTLIDSIQPTPYSFSSTSLLSSTSSGPPIHTSSSSSFTPPASPPPRFVSLACGFHHLLAVADDGTVYACGKTDHGALGLPLNRIKAVEGKRWFGLTAVTGPKSVVFGREGENDGGEGERIQDAVAVCAGFKHSLLLTRSGYVYSCGKNSFGQLGTGPSFSDSPTFTRVGGPLVSEIVVKMASGQYHCLALCASGRVYAWGLNKQGQCGQGTEESVTNSNMKLKEKASHFHTIPTPTLVHWQRHIGRSPSSTTNKRTSVSVSAAEEEVVGVSAGFYDSVLTLRSGEAIAFGGGLAVEGFQLPRTMWPQFQVQQVAYGLKHAIILASPAPVATAAATHTGMQSNRNGKATPTSQVHLPHLASKGKQA